MSRVGQPTLARQSKLNVNLKDLQPWTPDIDPRRQEKPGIISGSNFVDFLDGPQSYFSSNFYDYNYWSSDTTGKVQSFRIASSPYFVLGTSSGLWLVDPVSFKRVLLLNQSTSANPKWPWTCAYVGGLYYFAQYNIGLWQYDPVNNTIIKIVTPVGDNVSYVAAAYGRLIFLGQTIIGVSALDDGTNLTPSLATAAGAQPLSIIGGVGYAINTIPDGFLVYTSQGVIKATFTQEAQVFNYAVLPGSNGIRIFTPNAVTYIPRVGSLCLDNTGFNLTKEWEFQARGIPQPWQVPMGDFVKKNIVASLNQSLYGTIDVFYCLQLQLLFISFSSSASEGVMTTTLVWSAVSEKWGSFDHTHTGIFEVYDPVNNVYQCAYMATDGYIRYITNADFSYDFVSDTDPYLRDYVFRPGVTDDAMLLMNLTGSAPIYRGSSDLRLLEYNPAFYSNYTATNLFSINNTPYSDTPELPTTEPVFDTSTSPMTGGSNINFYQSGGVLLQAVPLQLPQIGLNSNIVVGPMRFPDSQSADETSAIETVMVGSQALANFVTYEDWENETAPAEDWNALSGQEDWGFGLSVANEYILVLHDTDDGVNDPIQGPETLPIWDNLGSAQIFKPMMFSSIYHNLEFDAVDAGQSFALKTIDITGLLTGVIQSV